MMAFDPYDRTFQDEPYATYRALREETPVYRDPPGRFWALSRFADALDAYGRLDVVANIAGVGRFVESHAASFDEWQRTIAVNLTGVNCICPGGVDTAILAGFVPPEGTDLSTMARMAPLVEADRLIRPEEIAEMVAYLASERAAVVTGVAMVLDAGMTA